MIDIYGGYVYKKNIDWSTLHQGISIPVTIQKKFIKNINSFLVRGESKPITIQLNEKTYKATLVNQLFDGNKYQNRADIIQIRYAPTSDLAIELRKIFDKSYKYFALQRAIARESSLRKTIVLPDEMNESIAIYNTDYQDTYYLEVFTTIDYKMVQESIAEIHEQDFEYISNYNLIDEKSNIVLEQRLVKVRRLNRAIGECLKELYNYNCQVCGTNVSLQYDVSIVESHHIDPFVKSLNNNACNQIVLCPNHHSVIHKADPEFNRKKLLFIYRNGLEERVALNRHL